MISDKKAVVLFSGGRDSLLASCLQIENGYEVLPLICDNSHISGVDRAYSTVEELHLVYGFDMVGELVIRRTGFSLLTILQDVLNRDAKELASAYPFATISQINCLACKTAMYISALRYCKSCGADVLVDGVRKCQGFFVDQPEMLDKFKELCASSGVVLSSPVYELESDLERKRLLDERGLPTKTLEPQCYLGCPMTKSLSPDNVRCMVDFYEKEVKEIAVRLINKEGDI